MPLNSWSIRTGHQEKYCNELVSDTMKSSPSFNMLARVSLNASFTLLLILFHIVQGRGSAFKTSSTGANPGFTDFFSKGTSPSDSPAISFS